MTDRNTYHHGDLKAALLAAALDRLEAEGLEAVSLRGLAKDLGVSPNAPYRHFADKDALWAAVAAEGFRQFADRIEDGRRPGDPWASLRAEARAYLDFASAHPALYRLMFSPLGYSLHSPSCAENADRAFGCLIATSGEAQALGWRAGVDPVTAVLTLWSALHGWAGLLADRLIPPGVPISDTEVWLDTILGPL